MQKINVNYGTEAYHGKEHWFWFDSTGSASLFTVSNSGSFCYDRRIVARRTEHSGIYPGRHDPCCIILLLRERVVRVGDLVMRWLMIQKFIRLGQRIYVPTIVILSIIGIFRYTPLGLTAELLLGIAALLTAIPLLRRNDGWAFFGIVILLVSVVLLGRWLVAAIWYWETIHFPMPTPP